ncbi:MAG TPA: DUF389 domain-containing protein [Clostridia bacterium]|nr:DUF389 domain-containing protein [Clostridia bacterium]
MARVLQITVPADQTEELIQRLKETDHLISMKLYRGASVKPPGDVIAVEVINRVYHPLLEMLARKGIGATSATGLSASEPTAIYSRPFSDPLARDISEASSEEMDFSMAKEGNMTANGLALMFCGGTLATLGLTLGAVELVIAAMIISPGFESLARIGLGISCGSSAVRRGVANMLKAYAMLFAGAVLTALILQGMGKPLSGSAESYLEGSELVKYWSSLKVTAFWSGGVAAIAGVVLTAAHRSILTAGAMVGLALVPAAALVSMGLVAGDFGFAGKALGRWFAEVVLVVVIATVIFLWKRLATHKRKMING